MRVAGNVIHVVLFSNLNTHVTLLNDTNYMNVTLLSENIIRYCNNSALIGIGVTYVVLK